MQGIFSLLFAFYLYLAGTWNFSEPKAVGLGKAPVMAMAAVKENLWCSCGNKLFILDCNEEIIKVPVNDDIYKKKERKKKKRFIEIAASEESYTGPRRSS